jgi:hypothetical protein
MADLLRRIVVAFASILAVGTVVGIVAFFVVEAVWRAGRDLIWYSYGKVLRRKLRTTARTNP